MKKIYISPQTDSIKIASVLPIALSTFDKDQSQNVISLSSEEADEFTSRGHNSMWDDPNDDE